MLSYRVDTLVAAATFVGLSFLFGGNTAERRAATARAHVEVMRWERVLQAAREMAKTPEENAQIEEDIRLLGELTRYWE